MINSKLLGLAHNVLNICLVIQLDEFIIIMDVQGRQLKLIGP